MLPVFLNLNYKLRKILCLMCCSFSKVIKSDSSIFLAIGGWHEHKTYGTLQAMAPTDDKIVHQTSFLHIESNLDRLGFLSPTQPGPPAFSATKLINQTPIFFINKPKFLKATRNNAETRKIEIPWSMVVENLSW